MNHKLKTILITLSTLAVVACNGGGGGGSSNPEPGPTVTPPPIQIQPLNITQKILKDGIVQDGSFSLNKVGSHQIWYMIVNNPNTVSVNTLGARPNYNFRYDGANDTPINPTKYAMKYTSNEISGVTLDCLSYNGILPAGQSCAYKFDAQWGGNITSKTNFSFNMAYSFFANNDNNLRYVESSIGCVNNSYTKCLSNNQNLQFNLMNLSHQANDLNGYTAMTNNLGGNIISMDGSTYWDASVANTANVYTINYNSSTNTYTKTLANTYTGGQFGGGFSALNTNGSSYYWNMLNQTGIMTNLYNLAQYGWGFTYGLNGSLYADNPTFLTSAYLLNQNGINSTVTPLTTIGSEATYGINTDGSLWTYSDVYPGNMYCYDATNNYAKTTMNLNGLDISAFNRITGSTGYYVYATNNTDYYDINLNTQQQTLNAYKVNFNNCSLDKTNYYASSSTLPNQQYGVVWYNYNGYIESVNQFSNGLNGGN